VKASKAISISILAIGLLAGSAVGVAAQDEALPTPPQPFTGVVDCGGQIASAPGEGGTYDLPEGSMTVQMLHGNTWRPSARTMSDPRLEGTYSISFDEDRYFGSALADDTQVGAGTWRIENDEGAWQGSYHIFGMGDGADVTVTVPLIGEGAYEGLTAIVESAFDAQACRWDWRGLILRGELPAYPEPPAE
jgi:hypothetical protein